MPFQASLIRSFTSVPKRFFSGEAKSGSHLLQPSGVNPGTFGMNQYKYLALGVIAALSTAHVGLSQPCMPTLHGFPTGPLNMATSSPNEYASVTAMMPYEDDSGHSLIVAGRFMLSPAPFAHVARYQNGIWTPMALPQQSPSHLGVTDLAVQDFAVADGPSRSIYALGMSGFIYRWTGSQWEQVGTQQAGTPKTLLAASDEDGPVLLMGRAVGSEDELPLILAWRGSGDWTSYSPNFTSGSIARLRVIDDGSGPVTFAVGEFSDLDHGIRNIAKHVDGEWAAVPFDPEHSSISDVTIFDAGTHGSELYVSAVTHGAPSSVQVYRLRSGQWLPVLSAPISIGAQTPLPTFFKLDRGEGERLYLAGYLATQQQNGLVEVAPGSSPSPLYFRYRQFDNTTPGAVLAAATIDDGGVQRTFLGGDFIGFAESRTAWNASSHPAFSLVQSDAASPLGYTAAAKGFDGPTGPSYSEPFYLSTLKLPEGERLLITAYITRADGLAAANAVLYDGTAFSLMNVPQPWTNHLQNATVAAIDGQLRVIAAARSSLPDLGPLAYWTGSQWTRMLPVLSNTIHTAATLNGELLALTSTGLFVYRDGAWVLVFSGQPRFVSTVGDLGQGERFYFAASGPSGIGIYEFDGQNATILCGADIFVITSMVVHDDGDGPRLYASKATYNDSVVRLEGSSLVPMPGLGAPTNKLASWDDGNGPTLYAAGNFQNVGGEACHGIARWRNNAWECVVPLVPQFTGLSQIDVAVFQDKLYIAGSFTSIGPVNADHFAYFEPCRMRTCTPDFNGDGDHGTDADIEAFFACLAGSCCPRCTPDFDGDGNAGTDEDIEAFFRVLAGGNC
jgi:hypothetical protein